MNIILASSSKRRSSILDSCGIKHKVIKSGAKERLIASSPLKTCTFNARIKAETVRNSIRSGYIIGADTVCFYNKKIIGKPYDLDHAKRMLKDISGKSISVYTGLCIIDIKKDKIVVDYDISRIRVRRIKNKDFSRLISLLGPYDKAGGFSIEGAGSLIFDDINGSYFNILGLPMIKLKDMFERLGINILDLIRRA